MGSYIIHKDLGKGRYLIQNRAGVVLKNSVHSMRLKKYFSGSTNRFVINFHL